MLHSIQFQPVLVPFLNLFVLFRFVYFINILFIVELVFVVLVYASMSVLRYTYVDTHSCLHLSNTTLSIGRAVAACGRKKVHESFTRVWSPACLLSRLTGQTN